MDFATITTSLVSAFIGTFFGSHLLNRAQENKMKKVREIAIKGLDLILKYSKNGTPYSDAEKDFNNALNISEKRAVLVCLHKIGVPLETDLVSGFNIKEIRFSKTKPIDSNEIELMKLQIKEGYCDNLFFIDVENHFSADIRIKKIRSIAEKYISKVFAKSKVSDKKIIRPENWQSLFSNGEFNAIAVFIEKTSDQFYFDKQTGVVKAEALEELLKEVNQGLWDFSLQWDYDAYKNMIAQRDTAELTKQLFNTMPSRAKGEEETKTPERQTAP